MEVAENFTELTNHLRDMLDTLLARCLAKTVFNFDILYGEDTGRTRKIKPQPFQATVFHYIT